MNASAHSSIGRFLVSIPHTESCAVTTYKEDSYDIFMEAKPYLCMGSSSLVLSELRG